MISKALVAALMEFASIHSGLPIPAEPPAIRFDSRDDIKRDAGLPEAYAAYINGEIVLPYECDINTLFCKGVLLHEIVHYMDDENGTLYEGCMGKHEKIAYRVEGKFYQRHGSSLAEHGMPLIRLMLITECPATPPYAVRDR